MGARLLPTFESLGEYSLERNRSSLQSVQYGYPEDVTTSGCDGKKGPYSAVAQA